ncbi:MAG: rhomboid family intramembrane serine protease [archaeon]
MIHIIIFVFTINDIESIVNIYGVIPKEILSFQKLYTLFSSLFIHASIIHLISNMVFFSIFGPCLEKELNNIHFISIFFITGLIGNFVYIFSNPTVQIPAVGASGALFGFLGVYLITLPKKELKLIDFHLNFIKVNGPTLGIIWIGIEIIRLIRVKFFDVVSNTSQMAHLGGFVSGVIIEIILVIMSYYNSKKKKHKEIEL